MTSVSRRSLLERLPILAEAPNDVQVLRAVTAVELVVVSVYESLLVEGQVGGAGADPAVRTFVTTTLDHHRKHLAALQSYTEAVGGVAQRQPDPHYQPVAKALIQRVKTAPPADAARAATVAAASFENVAASSCAAATATLSSPATRELVASISTVEAQHLAALLVVGSLISSHEQRLLTYPVDGAGLPPTALLSGVAQPVLSLSAAAPSVQALVP